MFISKTKNPCKVQKGKRKREINRILCCLTAVAVGVTPAWASGVGDILLSMTGGLITIISQFILGLMEIIAGLFLKSMSIDITSIDSQIAILSAFEYFAEGIRILSIFIAAIVAMWHIFVALWGPLVGAKQTQSVGASVARALIFIPGCFVVQDLAMIFFRELQKIYNAFLTADAGGAIYTGLSEWITLDTVKGMMGADITTGIAAPLQDAAAILISCSLVIIITWNFIKFLLEMTQRFVIMLIYAYLSPLACACGVSPGTEEIAKRSLATFFSSGILWILNVWCVGVGLRLFQSVQTAVANVATFFLWALVTYGFFKIIQQLDDIFNAVGANNVRLSGSMLDDLVSMNGFRKAVADMGKTIGGVREASKNFAQNGFFGAKGTSSENPVTPQATKIRNMAGGIAGAAGTAAGAGVVSDMANAAVTGAGAIKFNKPQGKTASTKEQIPRLNTKDPTMATTEGGTVPRTMERQFSDAVTGAIKASTAGMVIQGLGQTGKNIMGKWNAMTNEDKLAQDNAAVATVHDALSRANAEDRNARMKNLAQMYPSVFANDAVKQYVGETLGLGEKRKVTGLNVDKNGVLSATTMSADDSGKITMDKISDVGQFNEDTVTGKIAAIEPQSFTGSELSELRENQANLSFESRGLGEDISGTLIKNEAEPGSDTSTFSFVPDMGSEEMNNAFAVDVKAPKDMSAEQVGNVLMGVADAATVEKFRQGGGDKQKFDNAYIPSNIVEDTASASVQVGNDMMNSPDTEISVSGFDGISSVALRKTASENGNDYWSAYSGDNYISDIEVPSGTGAKEVADRVLYSDGENYEAIRQAAEINNYPEGSEVIFTPAQTHNGTSTASTYSTAIESESFDMAHPGCEFTYEKVDDSGKIVTSTGYITPTGHSDASGIEYQFGGKGGQWNGVVNIDASITAEELAAALAHKDGLGIEGVREVRRKLGIQNALSDEETKSLREALTKARKATAGTEENPVGK